MDLTDRQSMRAVFGSSSGVPRVDDDVDDGDAIDFLFGRGKAVVDSEGLLKVPKPEPIDLTERDHRRMYRARVLEGDLQLVPVGPIFWGPLVSVGDDEPVGVFDVEVDGVEEFVEDVVEVLVEDLLESMV